MTAGTHNGTVTSTVPFKTNYNHTHTHMYIYEHRYRYLLCSGNNSSGG